MLAWLLWAVAAADEPELSAADQARARELFLHGQALYDEARFDEAAAAFQLAYSLSGKPLLLYNMASPLERLGRWAEALDALQKYRPHAPPEEVEALDRRIAGLQAKVDEERAKEQALADAERKAATPTVVVQEPERRGPKPAAVALFGVGAVGLGSGTFFTVRALSARGEWTDACVDGDPRLCPDTVDPLVRRDRTSGLLADVSWLLGLGAIGGGVAVSLGGGGSADLSWSVGPGGLVVGGAW